MYALCKTRFITFLLLFVMNLGVFAQSSYQPAEENLKARQEFQDNKFGIFFTGGYTLCSLPVSGL